MAAATLAGFLISMTSIAAAAAGGDPGPRPQPPSAASLRDAIGGALPAAAGQRASGVPLAARAGGVGGDLFPGKRVVALYGSPVMPATVLGRRSVRGAKRKLRRQARAYEGPNRKPVVPAFDLVAVVATSDPGPSGKYRKRYGRRVIAPYLDAARALGGRLMLDIQPGRSSFLAEARAMREWLVKPRVDLALDPEWAVGRRGVPGRDEGSVSAGKLNRVSSFLQRLARRRGLPPKLMVVHQFRRGSIRHRSRIERRPDVDVTLDFDGIGSRSAKASGYKQLSVSGLFDGFMLFYRLDDGLMTPRQVFRLDPKPDLVVYQ